MLHFSISEGEGDSLGQRLPFPLEDRHLHGLDKLQLLIAQQVVGQTQAFFGLLLVGGVLNAQAEDGVGTQLRQQGKVVTIAACFGRAAAGTRRVVPLWLDCLSGAPVRG